MIATCTSVQTHTHTHEQTHTQNMCVCVSVSLLISQSPSPPLLLLSFTPSFRECRWSEIWCASWTTSREAGEALPLSNTSSGPGMLSSSSPGKAPPSLSFAASHRAPSTGSQTTARLSLGSRKVSKAATTAATTAATHCYPGTICRTCSQAC